MKILMQHIESGAQMVLELQPGREVVPARLQLIVAKKEGWLPVQTGGKIKVIAEPRESNGGPAGYRTASAFLKP